MKIVIVLLAIIAVRNGIAEGAENELNADCLGECPKIFQPVCGFDGTRTYKYFTNSCVMAFEGCKANKVWKSTKMIHCFKDVEVSLKERCMRPCPYNYLPLCATHIDSGVQETFPNRCVFDTENCLSNEKWKFTMFYECN